MAPLHVDLAPSLPLQVLFGLRFHVFSQFGGYLGVCFESIELNVFVSGGVCGDALWYLLLYILSLVLLQRLDVLLQLSKLLRGQWLDGLLAGNNRLWVVQERLFCVIRLRLRTRHRFGLRSRLRLRLHLLFAAFDLVREGKIG